MGILQTARFSLDALALSRIPRQSPEQIARLQARRLWRLVRHAVARSPFYREKYRGLDAEHMDLSALPPTNKAELMAHFDGVVTDPSIRQAELERFLEQPENLGRYFLGRYVVSHTSGSQGQPMLLVQESREVELLFSLQMTRGNAAKSVDWLEVSRRLWSPARLAVLSLRPGFYPTASAFAHVPAAVGPYLQIARIFWTDPDWLEQLNTFQPTAITAYAHVLERLALEVGRLRLAPILKQLVNNSEMLTERARARIEAAFGVPVLDNYALGECPFLSNGCPAGAGAHVNADWAILEVVDDAYQPVLPGKPGQKVLITNLANQVQPILRYEVGDIVTLADEPCRCGSRLPKIAQIAGRASEVFWFWNGSDYEEVLGTVVKNACDYLRGIREWQAVQTEQNHLRVRVEPLPGAVLDVAKTRRLLIQQLELFGLPRGVTIELEVVPVLGPDPATGKFRRIVSLGRPLGQAPTGAAWAPAEPGSLTSPRRRHSNPASDATVTPAPLR